MSRKIRIVIADDHPLLMQGLVFMLNKNENLNIIGQASDGAEALALIRDLKPDIAILDVQMPNIDGFEVAKTLIKENIDVKIVFLTMFKDASLIQKVIDLGVKGYVLKENAVTDIVNCVEIVAAGSFFISQKAKEILLAEKSKKNRNIDAILTTTEEKVLNLIAHDKNSKIIADELFVSVKTVENHRSNICKKLGLTGNAALLRYVLKKTTP